MRYADFDTPLYLVDICLLYARLSQSVQVKEELRHCPGLGLLRIHQAGISMGVEIKDNPGQHVQVAVLLAFQDGAAAVRGERRQEIGHVHMRLEQLRAI